MYKIVKEEERVIKPVIRKTLFEDDSEDSLPTKKARRSKTLEEGLDDADLMVINSPPQVRLSVRMSQSTNYSVRFDSILLGLLCFALLLSTLQTSSPNPESTTGSPGDNADPLAVQSSRMRHASQSC